MYSVELTCASFFAGVGGIDLGFESQGFVQFTQTNLIRKQEKPFL